MNDDDNVVSVLEVTVLHQVKFVNGILLKEVGGADGQGVVVTHWVLLQHSYHWKRKMTIFKLPIFIQILQKSK